MRRRVLGDGHETRMIIYSAYKVMFFLPVYVTKICKIEIINDTNQHIHFWFDLRWWGGGAGI